MGYEFFIQQFDGHMINFTPVIAYQVNKHVDKQVDKRVDKQVDKRADKPCRQPTNIHNGNVGIGRFFKKISFELYQIKDSIDLLLFKYLLS